METIIKHWEFIRTRAKLHAEHPTVQIIDLEQQYMVQRVTTQSQLEQQWQDIITVLHYNLQ